VRERKRARYLANRSSILAAAKTPEALSAKAEEYHRDRARAIQIYGGCCVECGSVEDLQFDHVNNDGAAHRLIEGHRDMVRRIKRLGAPLDDWELQLLCPEHHRSRTVEVWSLPRSCPSCGHDFSIGANRG
jgi:5-methylcytosine-specific restriction endonuclease McrA